MICSIISWICNISTLLDSKDATTSSKDSQLSSIFSRICLAILSLMLCFWMIAKNDINWSRVSFRLFSHPSLSILAIGHNNRLAINFGSYACLSACWNQLYSNSLLSKPWIYSFWNPKPKNCVMISYPLIVSNFLSRSIDVGFRRGKSFSLP